MNLLREARWLVRFQARATRLITELRLAISASTRMTARRTWERSALRVGRVANR